MEDLRVMVQCGSSNIDQRSIEIITNGFICE